MKKRIMYAASIDDFLTAFADNFVHSGDVPPVFGLEAASFPMHVHLFGSVEDKIDSIKRAVRLALESCLAVVVRQGASGARSAKWRSGTWSAQPFVSVARSEDENWHEGRLHWIPAATRRRRGRCAG